jgi:uracil-DNA glycosylase
MHAAHLFHGLPASWSTFLGPDHLAAIAKAASPQLCEDTAYPPAEQRFRAFECVAPEAVEVVIVGQDPYHGSGQAMGLSFSVNADAPIPPSLNNIFREYVSDTGARMPTSGDLTAWTQQGVLLINRVLTVMPGKAGSHRALGWEEFTNLCLQRLSDRADHLVVCLWGRDAQMVNADIASRHTVLEAPHPSPLSAHRGFFGSRPFSAINEARRAHGQSPLDWTLPGDLSGDFKGHTRQLF